MIARVVADVAALSNRTFDYLVPEQLQARVRVGTIVRVPLHGRRVRGWVVGVGQHPETDRRLLPIAKVSSVGPPADVVELAQWAAWRWAGPVTRFLGTASPPVGVHGLPAGRDGAATGLEGMEGGVNVVRVPPAGDPLAAVMEVVERGDALVLAPSLAEAAMVAEAVRRRGHAVAVAPREWARAAAGGCTVVGSRAAAWAPVPQLSGVVVLDEHDEAYQEERAPTWNARDVVMERARRHGVPCVLTSPCPSLEALAAGPLIVPSRGEERAGWPVVEVVDRREEPPGSGLYSARVVELVRAAGVDSRVVCVLNRKGRAVLLACAACGELARCERCEGSLESWQGGLRCRRCGAEQPAVCRWCGGTRFKALRIGVSRAREELELLAGQPVAEITGDSDAAPPAWAPVVVGTEAVLHRVAGAGAVVFLDFDQELLASRFRASEEALAMLARAARVVGGRRAGSVPERRAGSVPERRAGSVPERRAGSVPERRGRVVVQTRLPGHEVLDAAVHADPGRLAVVEGARRAALRLPPETALARISGPGADDLVAALETQLGVEVIGPAGDRWLARAADHQTLCDALAAVPRPEARVRVEVDPLRA